MTDKEHIEFMSKDLAPIDRVNYMNDRIEEKCQSERERVLGIIEKRWRSGDIENWEELKKEVEKGV